MTREWVLVEFIHCYAVKMGCPNDEVFSGHPLYGRGLDAYRAQRVINSRWLAEIQAINSVHAQYNPDGWSDTNHYVFWFHDSTFECLACGYEVELFHDTGQGVLARMIQRLGERD